MQVRLHREDEDERRKNHSSTTSEEIGYNECFSGHPQRYLPNQDDLGA